MNVEMIVSFKIVAFILLVKCTEFVSCGFTYDDDYAEINRDNYGFDLSEQRHVSAEQPKYNTMVKPYRGPARPIAENLAISGHDCDVTKYNVYMKPIHLLKTNTSDSVSQDEIRKLEEEFLENEKAGKFSWKDVCFHKYNSLYCSDQGKCECLEVKETGYVKALILAKTESYDRTTLQHYKHCRIRIQFGCDPSHLENNPLCEEGLFCSKIGVCLKSSSEQNRNVWAFTATLIVMYKFLCL